MAEILISIWVLIMAILVFGNTIVYSQLQKQSGGDQSTCSTETTGRCK